MWWSLQQSKERGVSAITRRARTRSGDMGGILLLPSSAPSTSPLSRLPCEPRPRAPRANRDTSRPFLLQSFVHQSVDPQLRWRKVQEDPSALGETTGRSRARRRAPLRGRSNPPRTDEQRVGGSSRGPAPAGRGSEERARAWGLQSDSRRTQGGGGETWQQVSEHGRGADKGNRVPPVAAGWARNPGIKSRPGDAA